MEHYVEATLVNTEDHIKAYKKYISFFNFNKRITLETESSNKIRVISTKTGNTIGYLDSENTELISQNNAKILALESLKIEQGTLTIKIQIDRELIPVKKIKQKNAQELISKYPELADVRFGKEYPNLKRFYDAYAYGIKLNNKTKKTIDAAIEAAQKANKPKKTINRKELAAIYEYVILPKSPADRIQIDSIKEYHGEVRPGLTRGEADDFLEYLEDLMIECPFCGEWVEAFMEVCYSCNKRLNGTLVPMPNAEEIKKFIQERDRLKK